MERQILLKTENITKTFPGVKALSNINFELEKGEVHALVGENGAGKSTFIKILMGVYTCDEGNIYLNGEKITVRGPQDSKEYGFRAVYQDINLATHLSVAENFFLGKIPRKHGVIVDWRRMYEEADKAVKALDLDIDVRKKVHELPIAQQEMVCIAKCAYENANMIIFDEPTALLTDEETEILFRVIRLLKERGISVIYISHRLEELFEICDRATVFKDGQIVGTKKIEDLTQENMISMMVGRELGDLYNVESHCQKEEVLRIENLTREGVFRNISIVLHRGEILGISGLVGSGRTEFVRSVFGAEKATSGKIYVHGKQVSINKPRDAINHGIGLLTEDRRTQSLALQLSVMYNINLVSYKKFSRAGLVDLSKEKGMAKKYTNELQIKTPSIHQKVSKLSGGNQQKVVIGKWLTQDCDILIFDEPTVGIDVGTKQEIYRLLSELTKRGISIIIISSYLPEVMGISDRIMVMHEGRCMGFVGKEEVTEELLMKYASGIS